MQLGIELFGATSRTLATSPILVAGTGRVRTAPRFSDDSRVLQKSRVRNCSSGSNRVNVKTAIAQRRAVCLVLSRARAKSGTAQGSNAGQPFGKGVARPDGRLLWKHLPSWSATSCDEGLVVFQKPTNTDALRFTVADRESRASSSMRPPARPARGRRGTLQPIESCCRPKICTCAGARQTFSSADHRSTNAPYASAVSTSAHR